VNPKLSRMVFLLAVLAMPSLALAQEDTSQRILPLPENDLSGLPIQMELLQKLRSMMEQKSNGEPGGVSPGSAQPNPGQFEQLRNALKSLTDQLPPDFVPPDLSLIPREQIEQTLKSPEVQQQIRKMLEQFAKDGVPPPITGNPSPDGSVPKSSADALQDFLRKLTGQKPRSEEHSEIPSTPSTTKPRRRKDPTMSGNPGDRTDTLPDNRNALPGSQPNAERTDQKKGPLPNQTGSLPLQDSDRQAEPGLNSDQEAKARQDSFNVLEDVLKRMGKPQSGPMPESQPDAEQRRQALRNIEDYLSRQKALPPELPVEPGRSDTPSDNQSFQSGRSGASPLEQRMVPTPPRGLRPPDGPLPPQTNGDGNPPQDMSPGRNEGTRNPANGSLKLSPEEASGFVHMMDAVQQQMTKQGSRIPPIAPPQVAQPRPPADRPPGATTPESARVGTQESALDFKKELEQRGFGGALKKILEQANQESRQPKSGDAANGSLNASSAGNTTPDAGLERSTIRMLDGLMDDLTEIAKDGKFRDRAPDRSTSSAQNKSTSDSSYSQIRKAASDLFSGVASAPKGSPSVQRDSSATGLSPLASGFDVAPVAVLAGLFLLVTAGYFGLRYWQTHARTALAVGIPAGSIRPHEIRSRADVVRAFHEFAMYSAKSVQSWWTHRAVEKSFATSTADQQRAAATLTDAYEQARYLPDDQEFSPDQLQQTRSALLQFTHTNATNR